MLEAAWHWNEQGIPVAIYELEEDKGFWLKRTLCQMADYSQLIDSDWVRENPEEAMGHYEIRRHLLDKFAECLYEAPGKRPKFSEVLKWVDDRCKEGKRIIIIDPITAANAGKDRFLGDEDLVDEVKKMAVKYSASIVLVTHPKTGSKSQPGLDHLAGGAAYSRFSQCVLWVKAFREAKSVKVYADFGFDNCYVNRSIYLAKTRNGIGQNLEIGFNFDGQTFRFAERGVIKGD